MGNRLQAQRERTPRPQRNNPLRDTLNGLTPERRQMANDIAQLHADLLAANLATQIADSETRELETRALQHVQNQQQMFRGVASNYEQEARDITESELAQANAVSNAQRNSDATQMARDAQTALAQQHH